MTSVRFRFGVMFATVLCIGCTSEPSSRDVSPQAVDDARPKFHVLFPGDGGSSCFKVQTADGRIREFCLSQSFFGPAESMGRLYDGAFHYLEPAAVLVPVGSETETEIVELLEQAIEPYVTPQETALREQRYQREQAISFELQDLLDSDDRDEQRIRELLRQQDEEGFSDHDHYICAALNVLKRVRILRKAVAEGKDFNQVTPKPYDVNSIGRQFEPAKTRE